MNIGNIMQCRNHLRMSLGVTTQQGIANLIGFFQCFKGIVILSQFAESNPSIVPSIGHFELIFSARRIGNLQTNLEGIVPTRQGSFPLSLFGLGESLGVPTIAKRHGSFLEDSRSIRKSTSTSRSLVCLYPAVAWNAWRKLIAFAWNHRLSWLNFMIGCCMKESCRKNSMRWRSILGFLLMRIGMRMRMRMRASQFLAIAGSWSSRRNNFWA
mmetsp:Transcript_20473/g.50197  ORF Transcript_20473/g.50197 Transcript_20473/m.50197 type:complete len:212 (+) Transcript_20473:603-1238(+)